MYKVWADQVLLIGIVSGYPEFLEDVCIFVFVFFGAIFSSELARDTVALLLTRFLVDWSRR